FHWVEGKVLILGHLDRNRFKIPEKRGTAEDPTEGTDSAQHLILVPYADLPEFDPRAEHRGQISDQFPEIDPAVGGKVEDHLVPVKGALRIDQFHLQSVLPDLLPADVQRLPGRLTVPFHLFGIFRTGDSDHLFQGKDDLLLRDIADPRHHFSVLDSPHGFNDDVISRPNGQSAGVKVIYFTRLSKADSCHCEHGAIPPEWPTPSVPARTEAASVRSVAVVPE